ncbi:uncharacterized protein LOC131660053 [Vicia villosa]|uniref:uncharacterized protein LOC131660053 n=1 Tax=Vicia villosa TaxID=3911 RepID=UPI00273B1752|nr:uncharacterized protein LOC131660053 [Vicia villosa]
MRTNVAARAAVGGDDMLSKWQLMAEQARQKREGGTDSASGSQPTKDVSRKSPPSSGRSTKDNQERERKGPNSLGSSEWTKILQCLLFLKDGQRLDSRGSRKEKNGKLFNKLSLMRYRFDLS